MNLKTNALLRSEETGGDMSATEIMVPPHTAGPPLHTGELSFAPRNMPHTLANHSDAPARYLLICTPAGFERHWARVAAEAAGVEPPQWALQPIPEVTVVGPQIAATA